MAAIKSLPDSSIAGKDVSDLLIEAGIAGLWRYDFSTGRISGDYNFAKSHKLPAERLRYGLAANDFRQSVHPADFRTCRQSFVDAARFGLDYSARFRINDSDDHKAGWKMVSAHGRLYKLNGGQLSHISGYQCIVGDLGDSDSRMSSLALELFELSHDMGDDQIHSASEQILFLIARRIAKRIDDEHGNFA